MKAFTLLMLVCALIATPALAANVSSFNPASLVSALQNAGYKAVLTKDDDGDPVIDTAADGNNIRIMFIGCKSGARCNMIQFLGVWTCPSDIKECVRNAQKFTDVESPAKALAFPQYGNAAVFYFLVFDQIGISSELFITNFELFSVYNKQFADSFR